MTVWEVAGLLGGGYLLMLARSAWKQGELRQFLWSLLVVLVLAAGIAGAVAIAIALDHS
ncbi:hypothetical protein [Azospirillum sp. ST 5-10]|uniref:hypothetical protein n=1 Tax=unclassified Azospirillum TaxID=2630922 RepID=UPI003F4A2FA2